MGWGKEISGTMKLKEAKELQCIRCNSNCKADRCMAWLAKSPEEPDEGQCIFMCVGTSFMKVAHIWAMMATRQHSNIIR